MVEFLKSLSNIAIISVTIIGFLALFFNALKSIEISLIALAILLFIGFIFLILFYIAKLENNISLIEQKFKRADDLVNIKSDIKTLMLIIKNDKKKN
jgi:amino acid transporter|tara:strand:+ start:555 stop:845 length:291 start_codon:yes stop_codon:yes gene_type:complete